MPESQNEESQTISECEESKESKAEKSSYYQDEFKKFENAFDLPSL